MFPGRLVSYHLMNRLQKASGEPPPIQHWNINWKRSVLQGYVFPDHFRLHCYKPRTADARWIIVLWPIGSFDCALRLCELPATKLVLWKKGTLISEKIKAIYATNIHSLLCISSSQNKKFPELSIFCTLKIKSITTRLILYMFDFTIHMWFSSIEVGQ